MFNIINDVLVQGDRMWGFGVGLFLVIISPQDLRVTAIYGLSMGVSVLLFGALVGDWVDKTPRLKGNVYNS